MKTAFDICIKNHRILVFPHGKTLVGREIQAALEDLADAKKALSQQRYHWATIQGYHAMFHAARALLFSVGYRETSHYCLAVAIEALYVGTGKLGREQYVYLYAAMGMRANADYRTKFSEECARLIVKRAEEFLEKGQEILNGINWDSLQLSTRNGKLNSHSWNYLLKKGKTISQGIWMERK